MTSPSVQSGSSRVETSARRRVSPVSDENQPLAETQFPISTTLSLPGWRIDRSIGVVFGVVVRSMGMAKGISAGFRSLAGGEVKQYTRLVEDSRRHAMDRMIENAQLIGANAVLSMRFDSSEIGNALTEIVAYGTAVVVSKE